MTDQKQTIYYFKPFKDENPKRTRNKILKRALSAKTHFFEKSHKINTFWETNSIENVWVTFYRRRVFKTFLAQLRDFWLEFILTQSRLKTLDIRLDIAPKSRKSFFEKMDLDNFCLLLMRKWTASSNVDKVDQTRRLYFFLKNEKKKLY